MDFPKRKRGNNKRACFRRDNSEGMKERGEKFLEQGGTFIYLFVKNSARQNRETRRGQKLKGTPSEIVVSALTARSRLLISTTFCPFTIQNAFTGA